MTFDDYLVSLGFNANPFQFFNADQEVDLIGEYFIEPAYFEDVWGNPANPISNIVYAPRGGGKSAQRIMFEKRAKATKDILAITYTNHDLSPFKKIADVNLMYHLTYLNRLLLLAFFNRILSPDFDFTFVFSFNERQFIYKLARIYLYETPASFPTQAIHSLKTIEDYALDAWRNFKEPIANVIKNLSKAKGFEVDLAAVELDKKLELSHKDNFINIIGLLKRADRGQLVVGKDRLGRMARRRDVGRHFARRE